MKYFIKSWKTCILARTRQDDELFQLVTDFAVIHEDLSFKAGMYIGFQIYKNMEKGYQEHMDASLSILESV